MSQPFFEPWSRSISLISLWLNDLAEINSKAFEEVIELQQECLAAYFDSCIQHIRLARRIYGCEATVSSETRFVADQNGKVIPLIRASK